MHELDLYQRRFGRISIDTIYFGGGTPNVLTNDSFAIILNKINEVFDCSSIRELTMEMNPGPAYIERIPFFKRHGVERVSVGVQSFDPEVLSFYGRNHDVNDSVQFLDALNHSGINNVSVDIIFGHQNHSLDQLKQSLDIIISRDIPHVSLYGLSIEPNTPFERQKITVDNDTQYEQYSFLQTMLTNNHYQQYEVSTFCLTDMESLHNIKYLKFKPVIGIGPGAHSYFMGHRYQNMNDYKSYINHLDTILPTKEKPLNRSDFELFLATRLRYFKPIYRSDIYQLFGVDLFEKLLPKLKEFSTMGWINLGDDWFMISDQGCIVLDELLHHLYD